MDITIISVIQCILLLWIFSIFITSIFEIFHREPPSYLFFGLCLILFGIFWIVNLKIKINLKPWIGSFFVSGLVGILLIINGIRILLKPPLRSWISCSLIILLVFLLFAFGPMGKKRTTILDFLDQIMTKKLWNHGWFKDIELNYQFPPYSPN